MNIWKAIITSTAIAGLLFSTALPVFAKIPNRDYDFDIEAPLTNPIPKKTKSTTLRSFQGLPNSTDLYIVRFEGPIQEEWKEEVEELDVSLGWYLPDFAYIVRLPDKKSTKSHLLDLPYIKALLKLNVDF